MDKSPEAFRTISEVADFLDTPAHVLRFWESRFPQIRPVKRAGGRRYYRPGDVALLAGIKKLLHDDGITIRGVQKILREQGIRFVAGLGSGESDVLLDDKDIEAVLSAEYGPRGRLDDLNPDTPEAMQTAQIISLETALNRPDANRNQPPVQPELWPPAPLDDLPASDDTEAWPSDPGDDATAASGDDGFDGVMAADSVAVTPLVDNDLQPVEVEVFSAADLSETAAAEVVTSQEPDAAIADGDSVAEAGTDEPTRSDNNAGAAEDDGVQQDTDESAPAALEAVSQSDEPDSTATVAALLRRVQPDRVAGVQPDLIRIRDHLIDLRARVSEAARRKAK